jgi:hypothetical protein
MVRHLGSMELPPPLIVLQSTKGPLSVPGGVATIDRDVLCCRQKP